MAKGAQIADMEGKALWHLGLLLKERSCTVEAVETMQRACDILTKSTAFPPLDLADCYTGEICPDDVFHTFTSSQTAFHKN